MTDTSLWATHMVRCIDCGNEFPVAYGGRKAELLRQEEYITDDCPLCGYAKLTESDTPI